MKFLLLSILAFAHEGGEHYLKISSEGKGAVALVWDMPLIQMGAREAPPHFQKDPLALEIKAGGRNCDFQQTKAEEVILQDHPYVRTHYMGSCESETFESIELKWFPMRSIGAAYPLFVKLESSHGTNEAILRAEESAVILSLRPQSIAENFLSFLRGGVHHILGGVDHVLFVLTLLIPSVGFFVGRQWRPEEKFTKAFWSLTKVITAFTVAHSITLSVVALGWLKIPARPVEVMIALSVFLAALNNIFPLIGDGKWKIAFLFGLFHGIGFAEILSEMLLPQGKLLLALLAYNIGVELGQLAIIGLAFPLLYALRRSTFYPWLVLKGASGIVMLVAAAWVVDRTFGLDKMPF